MQKLIVDALQGSRVPLTTAELRKHYEFEIWDGELDFNVWNTPERRRSTRISMGRALRQLEAAGEIKRNKSGEWYPAKDWTARDNAERERRCIAYHEAGHAVIGLALKMPIAFVTIKQRAYSGGHVSQAPVHHSIGFVYARGSYSEPIADMCKQDAFGNPVSERNDDWHADAVMSIAGGMAEAEFVKDDFLWRELASSGDMSSIAFARRKLGDKARSVAEYEAECAKLIKQHWPMIEAVAAKLLDEETLSGADVYSICWRVSRNVVRRQHLKGKRKGEGLI
jgi:hypothetical protein